MFNINLKRKTNGKKTKSNRNGTNLHLKSKKVDQQYHQLGVRRVSCGLLQYDGVYSSYNLPRKRN